MPDAERYALWDKLRLHPPHEAAICWEEIAELAEILPDGGTGVEDGEVIAWFNSPHAVFLLLDVKPGFRYMHVYTAISISGDESGKIGYARVMADLKAGEGREVRHQRSGMGRGGRRERKHPAGGLPRTAAQPAARPVAGLHSTA